MPTAGETKGLVFLAGILALGAGVRIYDASHATARPGGAQMALKSQILAAESARHAGVPGRRAAGKRRKAAPKPAKVDLDVATEPDVESLRGIGPTLARRIIADRDSFGPFGSREGLQRVRGVGPALIAKLDSTVTFSLLPRPMNTVIARRPELPKARRRTRRSRRDTLP